MLHRNCGGNIGIDVTSMYKLISPSVSISPKGILPGMVELFSNEGGCTSLICQKCQKIISGKDSFEGEILEVCSVCGKEYSPSNILVSEYIPKLCVECKNKRHNKRIETMEDRILVLYGELIRNTSFPTLLTILMK